MASRFFRTIGGWRDRSYLALEARPEWNYTTMINIDGSNRIINHINLNDCIRNVSGKTWEEFTPLKIIRERLNGK